MGQINRLTADINAVLDSVAGKQAALDASGFPNVGAENTLNLSNADNLQSAFLKLANYVAEGGAGGRVSKSVQIATAANLSTLQALEATVTLDDFLFEWDTSGTLTYTVIPLDKFIDAGAYVSHAFKGIVGSADENIIVFTALDGSFQELDLSRLANTGLTAADIAAYTGMYIEYGQAYITRSNYDALPTKPTFSVGIIEPNNMLIADSYLVASLPTATDGGVITVTDEVGGRTLAFWSGANWIRVKDNVIVS